MAYSDFSLEELKAQFGIELCEEDRLFADVPPVAISTVTSASTQARCAPLNRFSIIGSGNGTLRRVDAKPQPLYSPSG